MESSRKRGCSAYVVFWYFGEENKGSFESCAEEFEKETGIAVDVEEQQSLNYSPGV